MRDCRHDGRMTADTVDSMRAEFRELMRDAVLVPGRRSARDRAVEPGTPDFFVTGLSGRPAAVLFIRDPATQPTARQASMMARLRASGWRAVVACTVCEAIREVRRP